MLSRCLAAALAFLWLCIPAASLADEGRGHASESGKAQASGGPPAENENANPQGSEGATRGQDRAAEHAGEHQKGAEKGKKGTKDAATPKKGSKGNGKEKEKGHGGERSESPSGEAAPE